MMKKIYLCPECEILKYDFSKEMLNTEASFCAEDPVNDYHIYADEDSFWDVIEDY